MKPRTFYSGAKRLRELILTDHLERFKILDTVTPVVVLDSDVTNTRKYQAFLINTSGVGNAVHIIMDGSDGSRVIRIDKIEIFVSITGEVSVMEMDTVQGTNFAIFSTSDKNQTSPKAPKLLIRNAEGSLSGSVFQIKDHPSLVANTPWVIYPELTLGRGFPLLRVTGGAAASTLRINLEWTESDP